MSLTTHEKLVIALPMLLGTTALVIYLCVLAEHCSTHECSWKCLFFWCKKRQPSSDDSSYRRKKKRQCKVLSFRREEPRERQPRERQPPPPFLSRYTLRNTVANCPISPSDTLTDHNGAPLVPPTAAYISQLPSYRSVSPVPAYTKEDV